MRGTHLQVSEIYKSFGAAQVLQGIDLELAPGEFVAIVGRSGCGKSTLLRLIAGLDAPTEGSVLLDGVTLRGLNQTARIMFQDARLLLWQKVLENVGLGVKHNTRERSLWALDQVGLSEKVHHYPAALSGGQRQRVALARALVSQPRLLLLDEPLGALDALTRIEMQRLIENLWLEEQFTTLLITHDVEEAIALADRVVLIEQGKITMDLSVTLPRPRRRGSAAFAELAEHVLDRVLTPKQLSSPLVYAGELR